MGKEFKCSESSCAMVFSLCVGCFPYFRGRGQLQCKSCWHACGDLCIGCSSQKGQHNLAKFRFCKKCIDGTFCRECSLPPSHMSVRMCRACDRLALWCEKHVSAVALQSGLCAKHFSNLSDSCQYCPAKSEDANLEWKSCHRDGCTRCVRICDKCIPHVHGDSFSCELCWREAGSLCIRCHEKTGPNRTTLSALLQVLHLQNQ